MKDLEITRTMAGVAAGHSLSEELFQSCKVQWLGTMGAFCLLKNSLIQVSVTIQMSQHK